MMAGVREKTLQGFKNTDAAPWEILLCTLRRQAVHRGVTQKLQHACWWDRRVHVGTFVGAPIVDSRRPPRRWCRRMQTPSRSPERLFVGENIGVSSRSGRLVARMLTER